jgi:hypothetical protein
MHFLRRGLLAPRPTPKLEDHPSSAVRCCLFNLFTPTLHIGGRSSIHNPRTRHALVTGTHIHGKPITPIIQITLKDGHSKLFQTSLLIYHSVIYCDASCHGNVHSYIISVSHVMTIHCTFNISAAHNRRSNFVEYTVALQHRKTLSFLIR